MQPSGLHRDLSNTRLTTTLALTRPSSTPVSAIEATAYALRVLARRYLLLSEQITDLTGHLRWLLDDHAPALMSVFGAGPDTIAQLLITAGDNPDRLRSEAHFAALAGACPIPASSGKTNRHRLNRASDRQANSALYHVASCACATTPLPATTSPVAPLRGEPRWKSSAASNPTPPHSTHRLTALYRSVDLDRATRNLRVFSASTS